MSLGGDGAPWEEGDGCEERKKKTRVWVFGDEMKVMGGILKFTRL